MATDRKSHSRPPRLAFVVTEDWFFLSHFLERALAARDAGYEVTVIANDTGRGGEIRAAGLGFEPLAFARRRLNPFAELGTVRRIAAIYGRLKPDILHHIALKPILYGTLAARFMGIRDIVNAPVGMGFVFAADSAKSRVLRPMVTGALRLLLNPPGSKVVFENADDQAEFVAKGAARAADTVLIRGAGVDLDAFTPRPEPPPPVTVAMISRMLWSKGVGEYVEAARALRGRARFLLVGGSDDQNPQAVPASWLRAVNDEWAVEWLGHRSDVASLLREIHIACLPTWYREGLPKTLLEAMAAGKPVVTTDIPGCRDAVHDGENGLLVPPRNVPALVGALERLIDHPELRRAFGAAGRERAAREFSSQIVVGQTLDLYRSLSR